ncbi:MAG: hypothetical protein SO170_08100 [Butyribacter sp.]|nr:hypothetical protein [Butyribacter sp.]
MKYSVDDLLKNTYHRGEIPSETLNQTVLQMVKECDEMKQDGFKMGDKAKKGRNFHLKHSGIRRFATVAAVLAMVMLMGSSVVYAGKKFFGINYFWEPYGNGMPEKATKLVDDKPTVTVKEGNEGACIIDFKVSSVLCDSKYVVVTLDVAVKDADKYFLVTGPTDLTESVSSMSIGIDSTQSVGEYCNAKGLQPVQIQTELDNQSKKFADVVVGDSQQAGTGNGSIMICAERLTDDKSFTMGIKTRVILGKGEEYLSDYIGDTLQVAVEDKSSEQTAYYSVDGNKEYHVPDTAITLKNVKLTTTEVGTYSEIKYVDERTSENASADWIELCDETGETIKCNIVADGSCQQKGSHLYLAQGCYESIGLPEVIYISIGDSGKVVKLKKIK